MQGGSTVDGCYGETGTGERRDLLLKLGHLGADGRHKIRIDTVHYVLAFVALKNRAVEGDVCLPEHSSYKVNDGCKLNIRHVISL